MSPQLADEIVATRRQIVLVTASYFALQRLVLELHAEQTGKPQPETLAQLHRYIDVELDRLLQQLPAAERRLMDPR